jgi:hypothetical protein
VSDSTKHLSNDLSLESRLATQDPSRNLRAVNRTLKCGNESSDPYNDSLVIPRPSAISFTRKKNLQLFVKQHCSSLVRRVNELSGSLCSTRFWNEYSHEDSFVETLLGGIHNVSGLSALTGNDLKIVKKPKKGG